MCCCERAAELCRAQSGPVGAAAIARDGDALRRQLDAHATQLADVGGRLQVALQQWERYERTDEALAGWLREMEAKVKAFSLVATAAEKRQQLQVYQVNNIPAKFSISVFILAGYCLRKSKA